MVFTWFTAMNSSEEQLVKAKGNVQGSCAGSQMLWHISGGFNLRPE